MRNPRTEGPPFWRVTGGLLLLSVGLAGCGGGGGDGSPSVTPAEPTATLSGSVFPARRAGAQVRVTDLAGNALAAPVAVGETGQFQVALVATSQNQVVRVCVEGGQLSDPLRAGQAAESPLCARGSLPSGQTQTTVHVSALTSLQDRLVRQQGLTDDAAQALLTQVLGLAPDASLAAAPEGSLEARRQHLWNLGLFQWVADLGLDTAALEALLDTFAADLADGVADGQVNGGATTLLGQAWPSDPAYRFQQALMGVYRGGQVETGLKATELGTLPVITQAQAGANTVQFQLDQTPPQAGYAPLTVQVRDANGQPLSGLNLALQPAPLMYMEGHHHSTPHAGCTPTDAQGVAHCALYYLMSSSMNGQSTGYWEIALNVGDDTVYLRPNVGMAPMNETSRVNFKHQNASLMLFPERLDSSGNLSLYLAGRQDMMNFPGVGSGVMLGELAILSAQVFVTPDGAGEIELSADPVTPGRFQTSALGSLPAASLQSLRVRVQLNGEPITTDGQPLSEANGSQLLSVRVKGAES